MSDFPLLKIKQSSFSSRSLLTGSSVVFTLTVVVFVAARLYKLTDYSLWTDEIVSYIISSLGWNESFSAIIRDKVHPPLFYVLLKLWMGIGGQSLLWLKLFPFFTSVAAVVPFYLLCRELNLTASTRNISLALIAVNGYLIFYAQEVRMYSLLFFFTVVSSWLFARFLNCDRANERRALIFLFFGNLFLIYTHYFGWLVVGLENLFLLFVYRRKFWLFSISSAALALCFVPWIILIVNALVSGIGPVDNLDWIKRPSVNSAFELLGVLGGPLDFRGSTIIRLFLYVGPIILLLWRSRSQISVFGRRYQIITRWLTFCSILPIILVYLISSLGPKSVWVHRYLIIIFPAFMLLAGMAFDSLRPAYLRLTLIAAAVGWAIIGGIQTIQRGDNLLRVNWQNMVDRIVADEQKDENGVKVYTFESNYAGPLQFYIDEAHEKRFKTVLVANAGNITDDHFWVAFREDRQGGFPVEETLQSKGYRFTELFVAGETGKRVYLISAKKN